MAVDLSLNAAGQVVNSGATISISATIGGPIVVPVHIEDTGTVAVDSITWSLGGTLSPMTGLESDAQAGDCKVVVYEGQGLTTGAGTLTVNLSGTPSTMARASVQDATEAFAVGSVRSDTQEGSTHLGTDFQAAVEWDAGGCVLFCVTTHANVASLAATGYTVLVDGAEASGVMKQAFASSGSAVHDATWANGRRYIAVQVPLNPVAAGPGQPSIDALQASSDDTTFRADVTPGTDATSHTLHRSYSDPDFTPAGGNQIGASLGASITVVEDTTVDPANVQAYYKLRATDGAGDTDSTTFTYLIPPAVPTSVTATATASGADVTWTDNARAASLARVWRSASGSPFRPVSDVLSADEAWSDGTVEEGVEYSYALTAFIGDGSSDSEHSAFSNVDTATLADVMRCVPNVVGEVEITSGTQIQIAATLADSTLAIVIPIAVEKLTTIASVTSIFWTPDGEPAENLDGVATIVTDHANLDTYASQFWHALPTTGPGVLTVNFDIEPGRATAIIMEANRAVQLVTADATTSSSSVNTTAYGGFSVPDADAFFLHNETVEAAVTGLTLGAGETLYNDQSAGNTGRWVGVQTYDDGWGGGADTPSASWNETRHLAGVAGLYAVPMAAGEAGFVAQVLAYI